MQTTCSIVTLRRLSILLAATATLLVSGCAAGRFGSDLAHHPRSPARVKSADAATVSWPQREPLNITLTETTEVPGLDGAAESDAVASRDGSAEAYAKVTGGGTASALFQVGHAFSNETERMLDCTITVRFAYEVATRAEPDTGRPDAMVGLRLYARDNLGRLLRDDTLIEHTTEGGPTERDATETITFDVTLGRGALLNVFLAGQTQIDTESDRMASGRLSLRDLQIDVATRPAPQVQSANDEQG